GRPRASFGDRSREALRFPPSLSNQSRRSAEDPRRCAGEGWKHLPRSPRREGGGELSLAWGLSEGPEGHGLGWTHGRVPSGCREKARSGGKDTPDGEDEGQVRRKPPDSVRGLADGHPPPHS